ncbi:phospholipid-translocating P-type ATPase [Meira miltonrushii]|uniref:P-type phospholipid transporter n=1 Tax=Meira miltonrushii TaxID=1280837 RepID=A0A316VKG9_9BASI|nr:phospholipid-translocating P-type ATPase [Meira miltonrushii]PWN38046.1 phospholipid-translocating P-type ATPase [Meira miltonrushii]
MVFGSSSGVRAPQMDENGHFYDPNITSPYDVGPSNRAYISDPTHPEYDPAIDPNLQLRTVRTAAESIAESHRSEARREARQRAKRSGSILNRIGRGRTLLRKDRKAPHTPGIADLVQGELSRLRQGYSEGTGAKGTGAEGVGVPFDSAQQDETPDYPTQDTLEAAEDEAQKEATTAAPDATLRKKKKKPAKRRNVYLNIPPTSPNEVTKNGQPIARYPRNKVRTSKYTIVTFLPRFLSEQFRRMANVYFLGLVALQASSKFGATLPQIAMLPLVAILTITAIKDGLEDYRRHMLDNEVNNSAVTKLGNWRNVNQRTDPRNWFEKLIGLKNPNKISKGVRKLREKEDAIGLRVVGAQAQRDVEQGQSGDLSYAGGPLARVNTTRSGRSDSVTSGYTNNLDTIASESERGGSIMKPSLNRSTSTNVLMASSTDFGEPSRMSLPEANGVVDYHRQTPGTARWERTLWKKLEVGDVVLLRENEQVPADIVLLNSSDPDGNAFVETKNLDGETNLKVRKCLKASAGIQTEEDIEHARFVIDSEPPHANLYAYNGLLKYSKPLPKGYDTDVPMDSSAHAAQQAASRAVEPITANELLLRGCIMRNTDWVIGIVVFTGKDTKIMLNGGDTPSKRSKIEKETNVNVIVNFVILLVMCVTCAVVGGVILNWTDTSRDFYEIGATDSTSNIANAFYIFGTCLVLYQNIVPISLYISIELTKTIAAFFIYTDIDMYYEPLDHPCVPKTWGIVDDLGQIEYVFSDKTGTLTQNVMEFKKCSVNGIQYGEGVTEAMIGAMKREGKDISGFNADTQAAKMEVLKEEMVTKMNKTFKNRYLRKDKVTLISPELADTLGSATEQRRNVTNFFRALALCHTALADRADPNDPFTIEYKAQSPDEAALVAAARDVGAVFLNKNNHTIDLEVCGAPERLTPLRVLEFNSTRKRMSVIIREADGRLLMICKGADSVIYQRLRPDHPAELKAKTQSDLEDFANAGLRTLCIAYRYLEEGEYLEWAKLHDEASASLTDRDEAVDEVNEKIEVNLTLIGATALEDKLQVGVPEAIEKLHQAGIKLWILTGDKLQTAIEIGFSCNLLSSDMEIMIISADHEQGARAQLEAACNKIAASGRPIVVRPKKKGVMRKRQGEKQRFDGSNGEASDKSAFAVVVDGETLKFCLDKSLKPLFLALTTQCETVVCCRVSPAQKALTVRLVKDGIDAMTLSIGDGANDVSMIQEAHVGVGIAGLEGAQASMSADYAIGQFRYLAKLLLVHGHWNAYRIGVLHEVFFYKNLIWTFSLLLYQIFCEANATYLFDYSLVLLYNLVFTSLPVIMLGALDQDLRAPALMTFPQTYAPGREGKLYTRSQFWLACLDGVYQSIVCFGISAAAWYFFPIVNSDGISLDPLTALGSTVGACAVVCANLYCGMMVQNWSAIIWIVIILSNLSYFIWILLYSAPVWGSMFSGTAFVIMGTIQFWATLLLCVVASLLPRFTFRAWKSSFQPTYVDLVRQAWVNGDLKGRLGLRSGRLDSEKAASLMESGQKVQLYHDESTYDLTPNSHDPAVLHYSQSGAGGENTNDSYGNPQKSNDGYGKKLSVDEYAKQGNPQRNSLNVSGESAMPRATSSFSFYDPDRLPTSYTPEPGMSRTPMGTHREDEDLEDYEQNEYGVHSSNGLPTPEIYVQRASMSSTRKSKTSPYRADFDDDVINSRTALAAASSVDSFEQQFRTAFRPGEEQRQQHQPSPLHEEIADEQDREVTMSPLQRFHNRFQQNQAMTPSNSFPSVDSHDSMDALRAPMRPFAGRQQQASSASAADSEADGFHTPQGIHSPQPSGADGHQSY